MAVGRRSGSARQLTQCHLGVRVRAEAVHGHDDRHAELLGDADVVDHVGRALLEGFEVLEGGEPLEGAAGGEGAPAAGEDDGPRLVLLLELAEDPGQLAGMPSR